MLQLPDDVFLLLSEFLTYKERKALRLVNRRLFAVTPLRIARVFISPSYENLEVFRAIAAHPVHRKEVKEIIWDDARFRYFGNRDDHPPGMIHPHGVEFKEDFEHEVLPQLQALRRAEFNSLAKIYGSDLSAVPEPDILDTEQCWRRYSKLYNEQETLIAAGADIEAFKDGLDAFPKLERVTVTSAAYEPSWSRLPCYPTPLIRSFHRSFIYPAPRPWLPAFGQYHVEPSPQVLRNNFRGVTLVLAALAHSERFVPEFVLDSRYALNGVGHQFFDLPEEMHNLEVLCRRGLRRLDLAINTYQWHYRPGLIRLPDSLLKSVLATATTLEHFVFHVACRGTHYEDRLQANDHAMHVLRTLPLKCWPRLKHITLSGITVIYSGLVGFLQSLPSGIRSVELILVDFAGGTYKDLLKRCKEQLHWTDRPQLSVARRDGSHILSRKWWVQEEITQFMIAGGHNPFDGMNDANTIQPGFGCKYDDYDADFCERAVMDPKFFTFISPGVYRMRPRQKYNIETRSYET